MHDTTYDAGTQPADVTALGNPSVTPSNSAGASRPARPKQVQLELRSITLKAANDFVAEHHRHSGRTACNGGRFALAAMEGDVIAGVAIVGNPLSASFMDGVTAEVTRCCVLDDAPMGTCSWLYARAKRAWQALGGHRLLTYTLAEESGASLRGAGWNSEAQTAGAGGAWGRKSSRDGKPRAELPIYAKPKVRWSAPLEPQLPSVVTVPPLKPQAPARENEAAGQPTFQRMPRVEPFSQDPRHRPLALWEFFAGIGGAGVALAPHFASTYRNELCPDKVATLRINTGLAVDARSIEAVRGLDLPLATDLAWGSFPCKDHSCQGKQAGLEGGKQGRLVFEFLRVLRERRDVGFGLPAVCLENVTGFVSLGGGRDFVALVKRLVDLGFRVGGVVMRGDDFLPAYRQRLFLVAWPRNVEVPASVTCAEPDPAWTTKPLRDAVARLPAKAKAAWQWLSMPRPPARTGLVDDLLEEVGEEAWFKEPRLSEWLGICHERDRVRLSVRAGDGTAVAVVDAQRSKCPLDGVRRHKMFHDGVVRCLTAGHARQKLLFCERGEFRMRELTPREMARLSGLPEDFRLGGTKGAMWKAVGEGLSIPCVAWLGEHLLVPVARAVRDDRMAGGLPHTTTPSASPIPPRRARKEVLPEAQGIKREFMGMSVYVAHDDSDRLNEVALRAGMSKHIWVRAAVSEALRAKGLAPLRPYIATQAETQAMAAPQGKDGAARNAAPAVAACAATSAPHPSVPSRDKPAPRDFYKGGPAHSSNHGEWYTPPGEVSRICRAAGVETFDVDGFSPGPERCHVPARVHYTKEDDGLVQPWTGIVFSNPPYGKKIGTYVERSRRAVETGEADLVIGLFPARTDTKWWGDNVTGRADVFLVRGRIDFIDGSGATNGRNPANASAIVLWGASPQVVEGFLREFPDAGYMPRTSEAAAPPAATVNPDATDVVQPEADGSGVPLRAAGGRVRKSSGVAPHLSPFRYSGGKGWLAADVAQWAAGSDVLVEPFAGGASVALQCVLSDAVPHAVLSEKDERVRAFWHIVTGQDDAEFERLCAFLTDVVQPNSDWLRRFEEESVGEPYIRNLAARAIVRNRTTFGGIMHPRAGRQSDGMLGKRWNPTTVVARMRAIRHVRHRLTVSGNDALDLIRAWRDEPRAFFFVDPPYSHGVGAPGSRLYRHHALDHDLLLSELATVKGAVVATYNNSDDTEALAARHGFYAEPLEMRDGRGRARRELMMAKDYADPEPA